MSEWKRFESAPRRELTDEEADAVEDVLAIAAAWSRGEIPLPEALRLATVTPRAIGLAFRFRWGDPRRPALERLHMIEYGQRYNAVYTNFGWVSRALWEQIERNNAWRRQWEADFGREMAG